MKWCEHIQYDKNVGEYMARKFPHPYDNGLHNYNFCPICGTKRPEEPKELWEVLHHEAYDFHGQDKKENPYKDLANAAKAWFIERIDNHCPDTIDHHLGRLVYTLKDIKRAIGYEEN